MNDDWRFCRPIDQIDAFVIESANRFHLDVDLVRRIVMLSIVTANMRK